MRPNPVPTDGDRIAAAAADGTMSSSKIQNYLSERGAQAYLDDHRTKLHRRMSDRRERRILHRFFADTGNIASLLDVPSGFGRLLPVFSDYADEVVEADLSGTMLALNRDLNGAAADYLQCSALDVPRPDRSFDVVASIRLSHHLDHKADRLRHIAELCRLARSHVAFTYFSASSLKNRLRQFRSLWSNKRPKNCLTRAEVDAALASSGFVVRDARPLSRLSSGHVYVLAQRVDAGSAETASD